MIVTIRLGLFTSLLCSSFILAAPPLPPVNETPIHGTEGVSAQPMLCVDVSDPDLDPLNVTFHGRRVTGEDFTIIVLPDTQYYSETYPYIFDSQTQWIVEKKDDRNIVFVTHLGDIVEIGDNATEWDRADAAMSYLEDPATTFQLDGIPYGVAPGNHDQSIRGIARTYGDEGGTTSDYNQYFGVHRFAGREYYGGHYDFGDPASYPDNNDNNYQLFSAGGMDFLFVNLEFDQSPSTSRTAVLEWLDNLVMTYPDRQAIIMTHYMINPYALFSDQGQAIYDIVKDNPNVFLMLGGHVHGAARRTDPFLGNVIHSLLSDYQYWDNGGNGFLRVMTFSPENDEIRVQTYSPWLDSYETSPANDFTLDFPMTNPARFSTVGWRVYAVPSGGTACVPWPGRRAGVEYEWYVVVDAGGETTVGPRWTFKGDGACTNDADCADLDDCTEDLCTDGRCSDTGQYDGDLDAACEDVDNCPGLYNALQIDSDGDGRGDVCDTCALDYNPDQYDSDGDGSGDACDCQPVDSRDLSPDNVDGVQAGKPSATGMTLTWAPTLGADAYSVSRGDLADLGPDSFGDCLQEGVAGALLEDLEIPPLGSGWFYLVQGQNYDCSLGTLGYRSDESIRYNMDSGSCTGQSVSDDRAVSDRTVDGITTGSIADTYASDDAYESIVETISGGSPNTRHSLLEHHWTFEVAGGTRIEFHLEGYRKSSKTGDDFTFEYSTDGGSIWLPVGLPSLPTRDGDVDAVVDLPAGISGDVLIRVMDTDRTPGNLAQHWVSIDELFIRSIP